MFYRCDHFFIGVVISDYGQRRKAHLTTAALKNMQTNTQQECNQHTAIQGRMFRDTDQNYWSACLRTAKSLDRKFYAFVISWSAFKDSCFALLFQQPQSPHENTTINSRKFCNTKEINQMRQHTSGRIKNSFVSSYMLSFSLWPTQFMNKWHI